MNTHLEIDSIINVPRPWPDPQQRLSCERGRQGKSFATCLGSDPHWGPGTERRRPRDATREEGEEWRAGISRTRGLAVLPPRLVFWYSSYVAVLGQEPSLNSTVPSQGGGAREGS